MGLVVYQRTHLSINRKMMLNILMCAEMTLPVKELKAYFILEYMFVACQATIDKR